MAEIVTVRDLPPDFELALTGDWHVGAKACHEGALDRLVAWLLGAPHRYLGFSGDAVEGKPMGSDHFDPSTLESETLSIEDQFERVLEKIRPVKDRILWWGKGNHDVYLSRDVDVVKKLLCKPLDILHRMGGYQTWVDLGYFRVHHYHGRRTMPRGAKDPIQRDANQRAWLVNQLAPLAGDCALHVMGHVHALLVQPPVEEYALLMKGDQVRARYFREPTQAVVTRDHAGETDAREFIPVKSRWYVCSGTLRRSGGFGYTDYSEIAGYPPAPIGWCEVTVEGGAIANIAKVVV